MKSGPVRLADAADDFDREAHALLRRAAPGIGALVGARRQELVDQIAFRAHHLDAVVAGLAREHGAVDVGLDLPFDAPGRSVPRGLNGLIGACSGEAETVNGW